MLVKKVPVRTPAEKRADQEELINFLKQILFLPVYESDELEEELFALVSKWAISQGLLDKESLNPL